MDASSSVISNYKTTLNDHLRLLKTSITYIVLYVIFAYLIKFNSHEIFLILFGALILCLLIPSFILHYNYYIYNDGIEINEYEEFIEVLKEKKVVISLDEASITEIHVYMCANLIRYGTTHGWPMEVYNYLRFETPGEPIVVNNLVYPNLKKLLQKFPNIKPTYHETLFAKI